VIPHFRRMFVTRDRSGTTHCHDIFGYWFPKALIPGHEFREEIGRRYAIESKLVNI
jgi:hypothetical protein